MRRDDAGLAFDLTDHRISTIIHTSDSYLPCKYRLRERLKFVHISNTDLHQGSSIEPFTA